MSFTRSKEQRKHQNKGAELGQSTDEVRCPSGRSAIKFSAINLSRKKATRSLLPQRGTTAGLETPLLNLPATIQKDTNRPTKKTRPAHRGISTGIWNKGIETRTEDILQQTRRTWPTGLWHRTTSLRKDDYFPDKTIYFKKTTMLFTVSLVK